MFVLIYMLFNKKTRSQNERDFLFICLHPNSFALSGELNE